MTDIIAEAQNQGLKPVSSRPPLLDYLRQTWQRRHFVKLQAVSMALNQHQGTILGNLWLIVAPVMDGMVYFLIFGTLFKVSRGVDNFLGYLLIGIFLFSFTSRSVSNGTSLIASDRKLIRAFTFPKLSLPVALLVRELVALIPVLISLILLLVIATGTMPTWTWLLFPAVLAIHALFNFGLICVMARLGSMAPDLRYLMPYLVRIWFYGSCVLFTIQTYYAIPMLGRVAEENPAYLILSAARDVLIYRTVPPAEMWWQLLAWALGSAILGILFFWRGEENYAKPEQ